MSSLRTVGASRSPTSARALAGVWKAREFRRTRRTQRCAVGAGLIFACAATSCSDDNAGQAAVQSEPQELAYVARPPENPSAARDACPSPERLRIVAANLSSGTRQSYSSGEGGRILKALSPDVVLIQEFNVGKNSDEEYRAFVTRYFGEQYTYSRGTRPQQSIPNGIISRFPIRESGSWRDSRTSQRDFAWATVDIPGSVDLFAVSVHLLTANPTERSMEGEQLASLVASRPASSAYVAIGGDFNTSNRTEPVLTHLSRVVHVAGPWPADQAAKEGTNLARKKPYDWVLTSAALSQKERPVEIGGVALPGGLVFDSRVFAPLTAVQRDSDPDAVRKTDSGAPAMQHMAVVRDFSVCP